MLLPSILFACLFSWELGSWLCGCVFLCSFHCSSDCLCPFLCSFHCLCPSVLESCFLLPFSWVLPGDSSFFDRSNLFFFFITRCVLDGFDDIMGFHVVSLCYRGRHDLLHTWTNVFLKKFFWLTPGQLLCFSDSRSDFAIRSRLVHDFFHNSVVRFLVEVLGETVN